MIKNLFLVLISSVLFLNCSGSLDSSSNTIKIKGSDTMLFLADLLAREYMKKNPSVSIYVEGGGTATGIKALGEGTIDICTASRSLKGEEVKVLADKFRSIGMSTIIAKDGLSIFVHLQNPVDNISAEQVKKIFKCKIISWSEFNWEDQEIIPVSRNPNSGTYLYFKEHVLEGEDYCDKVQIKPTTGNIVKSVSQDLYSIGYGGIGYVTDSVKTLRVNNIAPTVKNIIDGTYPISRYLHLYTIKQPEGEIKKFIDWVISDEGQKVVKESGYIPIWLK
jgi:phosphate transport system substrate-binding protein